MKRLYAGKSRLSSLFSLILPLGLLTAIALSGTAVYAVTPAPSPAQGSFQPSQAALQAYVVAQAEAKGVNVTDALWIVSHESQWNAAKPGEDGNSRGLWQISRIWHPEVSDQCAYDWQCSTQWALDWIAEGHIEQWSTWRFRCQWYADAPDC